MSIQSMRREYAASPLSKGEMAEDPILQFRAWFEEATEAGLIEPNAMSLATAGADGAVTCRTVLLKAFDESGFVFFTNYRSRKAMQIEGNPRVSLLFPWLALSRQVEVVGRAEKISSQDSLSYFLSRPFGSRVGAWVSHQSKVISSRRLLIDKFQKVCSRFSKGEIPKPASWGGYRVVPQSIEFWQGSASRLHDRLCYVREGSCWHIERLSP